MTEESQKKIDSVLLIDDDDVVNTLNSIIIKKTNRVSNILISSSGEGALRELAELKSKNSWPGIIFVDINMPGFNGWDFIEMFGKQFSAERKRCIVCLLSSSLDPADEERASKSSWVDYFLSKPLSTAVVEDVTKKFLSSTK